LLWLLSILAVYVGLCLILYVFQNRLVYFPSPEIARTPGSIGLDYEDLDLVTEEGVEVHAWLVKHPNPRAVAVYCHGNAGNIGDRMHTLRMLHAARLTTLIFDYSGYGLSGGEVGEEPCYSSARAAEKFAREALATERIVLVGRSLGGGVATRLASERAPDALILQSTFLSLASAASDIYPFLPARIIIGDKYPSKDLLPAIDCPLFVAHGKDDRTIPFAHGEGLVEIAPGPKTFVPLSGGHNDAYAQNETQYVAALSAFLDEHLP
jgi:hypothetical protein